MRQCLGLVEASNARFARPATRRRALQPILKRQFEQQVSAEALCFFVMMDGPKLSFDGKKTGLEARRVVYQLVASQI